MKHKILVLDTSILCCLLGVPGKDTCGTNEDSWDQNRAKKFLEDETNKGAFVVLPLATIIETGNHIAQANSLRFESATELGRIILAAVNKQTPYVAFSDQTHLWSNEAMTELANEWPPLAGQQQSIGDKTIVSIAELYSKIGYQVEILTGDAGLKAYQPTTPMVQPRRRK